MIRLDQYDNSDYHRGCSFFKEVLWVLVRSVLFASWISLPSFIKVTALRLFGAKVGCGVVIRGRVNITMPWRVSIGDHVWIGDEVFILSLEQVTIGSHVCISQRAFLCAGSHDFSKVNFDLITRPITVGDSCWIGAQAFVGPGVTMGSGSRCQAGAVVVKDVDSGKTVGGVPAR